MLGETIHRLRKARGLTQLKLAHEIGWQGLNAGASVCRIERGQQVPKLETLRRMARVLGVSVGEILE
jgi:transcriptional regulator with XRE-family HTH domain